MSDCSLQPRYYPFFGTKESPLIAVNLYQDSVELQGLVMLSDMKIALLI